MGHEKSEGSSVGWIVPKFSRISFAISQKNFWVLFSSIYYQNYLLNDSSSLDSFSLKFNLGNQDSP